MIKFAGRLRRYFGAGSGQALVTLLIFVAVAMIITSAAVALSIINAQATSTFAQAEEALQVAQSGADNALLRLLRDPSYAGETVSVGNGTATITVSGAATKTIVVEATVDNVKRRLQIVGSLTNNTLNVTDWSEIE